MTELKLTVEENKRLTEWTRRRKSAQALVLRAGIVLACAQGELDGDAAIRRPAAGRAVGRAPSPDNRARSATRKSNKSSPSDSASQEY